MLRHLEAVGFDAAPRVVGSGFDEQNRETVSYVQGWSAHPRAWPEPILPVISRMLRDLHHATRDFDEGSGGWQHWFGRTLGGLDRVIGHCDMGPWNILVANDNASVTFIDWETAGPVDPMVELAQTCWLNAQLHDERIAEIQGLPDPRNRGAHMALILDGYELPRAQRTRIVDLMIDLSITDAADQARTVAPDDITSDHLWAISWRARSAGWIVQNRDLLIQTIR
ncbi:hypothetical protein ABIB25_005591 [Nakamurella sp. UYEF19]|uniref:phosphotransferase n=1 Tax=Nakamurella sp. UYEF19 TaxID=1756392 RepID=UPI003390F081